MCDSQAFSEIRKDIRAIKEDVSKLELSSAKHCAASEEKFKTIFGYIKWITTFILLITLILLLTVVYGAIGEQGLHAVSSEVYQITRPDNE